MVQKFDIGLKAKINDFAKKFGIVRTDDNDDDVLKILVIMLLLQVFYEEELDNVKSVLTNKAQGIDGIVIVVNNKLVSEEADLGKFGPTETIQIKIGFIKIETYFLGKEENNFHLYFERLRWQHINIIPPYSRINIETLARVYISVFRDSAL